jgi:hypothetical protein
MGVLGNNNRDGRGRTERGGRGAGPEVLSPLPAEEGTAVGGSDSSPRNQYR